MTNLGVLFLSVIGGIIIAIGLYSVVWGKRKDYSGSSPTKGDAQELPVTASDGSELVPATMNNEQKAGA